MSYTQAKIIEMATNATQNISEFYKQGFVNYNGKTIDTGRYFTEVVAEYLCNNIDVLETIPVISRKNSYKTEGHDGDYSETSNREEEKIAMDIFKQSEPLEGIGKILDYQTPLKNISSDVAGKIDLLSFDGKIARVLELKRPDSKETMLRCVLEGYTYLKTLDQKHCKSSFEELSLDAEFKTSPLVFVNSVQYLQYNDKDRNYLRELMRILDIEPFFIMQVSAKTYKVCQ